MYFNGKKIKLSFSKPKYQTVGNEVYCTLQYTVKVPGAYSDVIATIANDSIWCTATAKATCNSDDVFDKKLGRDISRARAEAKAYKQADTLVKKEVQKLVKIYHDMTLDFSERVDYIQQHDAEYVAEISK